MTLSAADIADALADIPDRVRDKRRRFTEREDQIILAGWATKTRAGLARYLGVAENTMRARYIELTRKA